MNSSNIFNYYINFSTLKLYFDTLCLHQILVTDRQIFENFAIFQETLTIDFHALHKSACKESNFKTFSHQSLL